MSYPLIMMYYTLFSTPLCDMMMVGNDSGITSLQLHAGEGMVPAFRVADDWRNEPLCFEVARRQVLEYVLGTRKEFQLQLNPKGTAFQMRVWDELRRIPYGETRSYGEVAAAIGQKKAARAVGGANNRNPLPLLIPCHRVIGAAGALTGFAHGVALKERLLLLERRVLRHAGA